jgi:hypothetical protein
MILMIFHQLKRMSATGCESSSLPGFWVPMYSSAPIVKRNEHAEDWVRGIGKFSLVPPPSKPTVFKMAVKSETWPVFQPDQGIEVLPWRDWTNSCINSSCFGPYLHVQLDHAGTRRLGSLSGDFGKLIAANTEKRAKVVKFAGIEVE